MAADLPHWKTSLLETPFFGGLSDASLDLLSSKLVERRFQSGETVVREGEPGRSMFIVHSGTLTVSMRVESRSVCLSELAAGDFFGEMTLINMQDRSATVEAGSPAVLYELSARDLYAYYKADVHAYVLILQNMNRELCRRLRHADRHIAALELGRQGG
ncbi:cyclic nucleotide-binding domain-containing protein [Nostoc sp. NIES-2111]